MLGNILPRRKEIGERAASGIHPVLPFYHRDTLSRQARRRLTIAFFIASFIFGFFFAILPNESKAMLTVPLFVMAAFILWLLPETGRPPTRFLTAMFFSYFVAVVLWPFYLAVQIPGMPLIEIRRVFLLLSVLGLLTCLSVSEGFRAEMKSIMEALPLFFRIFLAFVVVQCLSLIAPITRGDATMAFVRNQLQWTAIIFISMYVFSRPGKVQIFANMVRFLAVILAIESIFELQNQQVLWAGHIPWFLEVSDPAMEKLLESVFRSGEYRVKGPFSVSLTFAEFLCLTLPFFIQYILFGRNKFLRIVCVVCDLLVINAILDTQARLGLVGLMVSHAIYFAIWSIWYWRTRKDDVFGPAVALALPVMVALIGAALVFVGRFRYIWLGGQEQAASTLGRYEQAAAFPAVFVKRALFGYGPSQGGRALGYTNPVGDLSIDSSLLSIPLDYGFFGFVLYCAMYIFALLTAAKLALDAREGEDSYALPAAVTLAVWLTIRIVLSQQDNEGFMYIILGLVVALAYRRRKQDEAQDVGRSGGVDASGSEAQRPRGGFHVPGFARS